MDTAILSVRTVVLEGRGWYCSRKCSFCVHFSPFAPCRLGPRKARLHVLPPKLVGRLMWFGLAGLETNSDSIVGVDDLLFLLATFERSLADDYGCDAVTAE